MLNNCILDTFAKKQTVGELEITGTKISMTIKTLNDDMTNQTLAVEGFKVKVTAVSERSK